MKVLEKCTNSRGESFIELLIATFILGVTLTAVITAFMSGRSGIVSAWDRTEETLCASYIMEQLKATPYEKIIEFTSESGWNDFSATTITIDEKYESYTIQFRISPYEEISVDQLVQINVRVSKDSGTTWVNKASLLRRGDSS